MDFRLPSHISRTNPSRKVLLLLHSCSAHGTEESLSLVHNVDIVFSPPNTTSKLQLLDTGIFAVLNARYRKWQYKRAPDCIDAKVGNIYKLDQLASMKNMRRMWDEMRAFVLRNFWRHTGLLVGNGELRRAVDNIVEEILVAMAELVAPRTQTAIDFIINPDDEYIV